MTVRIGDAGPKGRGVFAVEAVAAGEVIEHAPVVVITAVAWRRVRDTPLYDYAFSWGEDVAFALGHGSLYNHSYQPNARYHRCFERGELTFVALCPIQPGEEITVNYNGDPACTDPVWFDGALAP